MVTSAAGTSKVSSGVGPGASPTAPAATGTPSDAVPGAPAGPRVVSLLNPANAVTASRFLTLPLLWWAVAHGYHQYATVFIIICGLLDKLDGLVAKLLDCRSSFGELFDAVTDGLCYGFGLILVAAYGWAPVIPVVCVIAMGIANSAMRFVYIRRAGRAVNYKSYAMERIVGFTGYLIGFATSGMEVSYFYWTFVPVMLVIVAHDARRMLLDPVRGGAA
jgi:phosphatidylglycerophosphate synthase